MTYIISTITDKSILMASDSRLNYHDEETDSQTGDRYQVIKATADCIRKTFIINPLNIGIQFIGIGYFFDNDEKYPLSHFIPNLANNINQQDSMRTKFEKIYSSIKKLTEIGNTGQYVNGVITGYENKTAYISTFNTFIDQFSFDAYNDVYVESEWTVEQRPHERNEAITYINSKITQISNRSPEDVGGPIEILEINPDGSNSWVQQNDSIFEGSLSELISRFNNDITSINGKFLNPPVKKRINLK